MARQRSNAAPRYTSRQVKGLLGSVAGIALVIIAIVLLVGGGDDDRYTPVADFADVHGMAVHSSRPNELYVATHDGLIRGVDDKGWARVGGTDHDLMGFSMHPTDGDVMWASGHPKTAGNLGVIHSTDGGLTWTPIALAGVDFHALAVSRADPSALYGSWQGEVQRSDDGGHNWSVVGTGGFRSVWPHPTDADTVFGLGLDGVHQSGDRGATWNLVVERAANTFAVDPHAPDTWYVARGPVLSVSTDAGGNWTRTGLDPGQGVIGFLAFHPTQPGVFYAATVQTAIYKTTDGGESWREIKAA